MAKDYSKTHKSTKAVNDHIKKIKKRGGKVVSKIETGKLTSLVYTFPDKKKKKKR